MRRVWTASGLLMLLLAGGCPEQAPNDQGAVDLSVSVEAPSTAQVGETVVLSATVTGAADGTTLSYEWFQEYGRAVTLDGAGSAQASFVAPSLPSDQALRFRVDVHAPDQTIHSQSVTVLIVADPDYGLDDTLDTGGDDELFPRVKLVTSMGTITLELNREKAPLTVNNFLRYVDDGFYDNTLFHRVIADFVIQGGGYDLDFNKKETRPPIKNESDNGLKNDRGTIAMARQTALDSATSQFYINVVDNDSLNATNGANGYTVFGRVVEGMDVVDRIAQVETGSRNGMNDVPVEDVILEQAIHLDYGGSDGGSDGSDGKGGGGDGELSGG